MLSRSYLCISRFLTLTSEGIHEGGEGPSEHLKEGVSDWVSLGPTQCCVLQDVWNTCAVHWGGAKTNTEGDVCVCVCVYVEGGQRRSNDTPSISIKHMHSSLKLSD